MKALNTTQSLKINLKLLLSAALLLPFCAVLSGQTSWTGNGDGVNWSDVDNWSAGLPDPDTQIQFLASGFVDGPNTINVDQPQTLKAINFRNTADQQLIIGGANLSLLGDSGITWNSTSGVGPITINSNIDFSSVTPDTNIVWQMNTSQPITLNGNITTSGTGGRTFQNLGNADQVLTLNGSNAATFFRFSGTGEVIAAHSSALGTGGVQKTSSATFSLRSDVTIGGSSYSWLQSSGSPYTYLRISELAPGTDDRTLTFNNRIAGSNGAIEWIDNINSTGKLILELKYNAATVQSLPLITNASAIVRFAQGSSTAARTYSGLISGAGSVELTNGSNTILTAANTYTGTTTVDDGTLRIGGSGTIEGTSGLHLGASGTFDLSDITPASYTFGPGQTLSGTGTVVAGGKDVIMQGTLSPGNSAGTLTFDLGAAGTLVLEDTVQLHFELGTVSDLILLSSGTLDIGSGELEFANFVFTELAGFGEGQYTLIETGENILGSLGSSTSGAIGAYTGELSIQGTDLVLTVIPEPKMLWLALFAAIPVLLRRRFQNRP